MTKCADLLKIPKKESHYLSVHEYGTGFHSNVQTPPGSKLSCREEKARRWSLFNNLLILGSVYFKDKFIKTN